MENKKLNIEDIDELLEKNKSRKTPKIEPATESIPEIKPVIKEETIKEEIKLETKSEIDLVVLKEEIRSEMKAEIDLEAFKEEIKAIVSTETPHRIMEENLKNIVDVLNQTLTEFSIINEKLDRIQEKSIEKMTESKNSIFDSDVVCKRDDSGKIESFRLVPFNK